MTKKYKSKKHLGFKDPYKQQEDKLNRVKDKIDAPPEDDEQPIPRKQRELFGKKKVPFVEDLKPERLLWNGRIDTKGLDYNRFPNRYESKGKQSLPALKQGEFESEKHFFHRIKNMTETFKIDASFKARYNVDTELDKTGKIIGWTKREDSVPMIGKKKLSKKKLDDRQERKKLKNKERDIKRKMKKRTRKNIDSDDEREERKHKMPRKDAVKFGEVVHAPPKLSTAHKLEQKCTEKENSGSTFLFAEAFKKEKKIDKSAELSIRQTLLEKERLIAVNAYRELKGKQQGVT